MKKVKSEFLKPEAERGPKEYVWELFLGRQKRYIKYCQYVSKRIITTTMKIYGIEQHRLILDNLKTHEEVKLTGELVTNNSNEILDCSGTICD